jgi:hypothetical protein
LGIEKKFQKLIREEFISRECDSIEYEDLSEGSSKVSL